MNYYRRKPKREIEIVLEHETWTVDLINNEIKNDNGELMFQVSAFNLKETYRDQLRYFMNYLKNNESPMNSLSESIEILKVCLKNG